MSVSVNGTSGITFNDASVQNTAATGFGFKSRIINGAMVIDQRNAGSSVTQTTANTYTLDRWVCAGSVTSKFTVQKSSTAPSGFTNSLLITSSAATTVSAGDYYYLMQGIEGFNVADLGWGTANAQTVTFSFWVRSSLTGTFGGAIRNLIPGATRSYPFTYTINAANTFEQKTITIAGDTSGTWATDNSNSVTVCFSIGSGSTFNGTAGAWAAGNLISATGATNIVSTNGATFYITGVQLEKGSTATSFDYRPYGTELQLCQRYCEKLPTGGYGAVGVRTTDWYGYIGWQTEKRANATVTLSGTVNIVGSVGDINTQTPTGIDQISTKTARLYRTGSSFTSQAGTFYVSDSILVTAEL